MRNRLHFCTASLWAGSLLASLVPAYAAVNSLTISEKAGVTTTNYPVQIGRPFAKGEISGFPQAVVNGAAVTTQADVKQRWSDGTVKHAILTFLIPTLSSGSTVTVTFRNQTSCNCGSGARLTKTQMLDPAYNFDALMQLTNGSTVSASARAMLNADKFSYWMEGSVATSVILADHSVARAFDIGFDSHRSFRPIFHATFWPAIKKVRVRFIGEVANTEALQDVVYSLALKTGNASPAQVYSKGTFTHTAASRWTKEFWIGGKPPVVEINHSLAYVRETKFLPHYDTARTVSSTAINAACNHWNNAQKDLYDAGNWTKYQPSAGSRPDIGPYTDWVVRWLYTGNKCMQEQAFGNADLAAAWKVHLREGRAGSIMLRTDAANSGTGVGRVLSLSERPGTKAADNVTPVGPNSNGGWVYDLAHEPEPSSPVYMLTGDFWYLEEMWFWASAGANSNGASVYHRGPTGSEGILNHSQVRAMAWGLRTRVHTAFLSPDNTPEKTYFETLINDAIAAEEGARNITTTSFNGNPVWQHGRQFASTDALTAFGPAGTPTPLHQWVRGGALYAQNEYGICSQTGAGTPCGPTVSEAAPMFETNYMMFALARTKELGYPSGALVTWLSSLYTGMLTDPGFNPFMIDNGRVPTVRTDGKYFTSFAELKTGYTPAWQSRTSLGTAGDPDAYGAYVTAAVSYLTGESNGQAAWNFMKQNFYNGASAMNDNPKWAIVPRTSTPPPVVTSSCDINSDGVTDSQDVQLSIDNALQKRACTADLNGNGGCDIVDVQRVVNATLTGNCRTGP